MQCYSKPIFDKGKYELKSKIFFFQVGKLIPKRELFGGSA